MMRLYLIFAESRCKKCPRLFENFSEKPYATGQFQSSCLGYDLSPGAQTGEQAEPGQAQDAAQD
jgi:hypothetical protein